MLVPQILVTIKNSPESPYITCFQNFGFVSVENGSCYLRDHVL